VIKEVAMTLWQPSQGRWRKRSGMIRSRVCPIASLALWPKMALALEFHRGIAPSLPAPVIASRALSTICLKPTQWGVR